MSTDDPVFYLCLIQIKNRKNKHSSRLFNRFKSKRMPYPDKKVGVQKRLSYYLLLSLYTYFNVLVNLPHLSISLSIVHFYLPSCKFGVNRKSWRLDSELAVQMVLLDFPHNQPVERSTV